jgi:hypothetical protein
MNSHVSFLPLSRRCHWTSVLFSFFSGLVAPDVMAEVEEDGRYWLNIYAQGKLPVENLYWSMDTHPRWRDEGKHFDTLILRPSIFYKVTPKASVWLGYDTVINHPAGAAAYKENRLWQQFSYQFDPVANVSFSSRSRLENRDREDFSQHAYRWRQMVRASMPSTFNPQFSWVVYDELFINFNDTHWGVRKGFDQNRLFLGVNWKFSDFSNADVGYMNQYVNTRTVDRENHILMTAIRFNF